VDNLTNDDLKQVINFFKQRANELELLAVQNQFVINRIDKEKKDLTSINSALQSKIESLEKEILELKEIIDNTKKKPKAKK
jgi:uncharacterized protein YceH (UPF0502 family)